MKIWALDAKKNQMSNTLTLLPPSIKVKDALLSQADLSCLVFSDPSSDLVLFPEHSLATYSHRYTWDFVITNHCHPFLISVSNHSVPAWLDFWLKPGNGSPWELERGRSLGKWPQCWLQICGFICVPNQFVDWLLCAARAQERSKWLSRSFENRTAIGMTAHRGQDRTRDLNLHRGVLSWNKNINILHRSQDPELHNQNVQRTFKNYLACEIPEKYSHEKRQSISLCR